MTFPEEAAYWTDDADGDPIIPAPARPRGLDALLGYVADRLDAAPAGEVVSVPPPARPFATGGIITDPPLLLVAEPEAGCTLTVSPPAADRSPSLAAPVAAAYGAPADEPAPVPPPAQQARDKIVAALGALWAAGVEEGRTETVEQLAAAECARRHHPMAGRIGEPCPGCGAEVTHHG